MSSTTTPPEATTEQQLQQQKPEPEKRPTKIPEVNPYLGSFVVCSNRKCDYIMRDPVVAVNPRNGERCLKYHCEPCNYDFYLALIHAMGECTPPAAGERRVPEIFQKGR